MRRICNLISSFTAAPPLFNKLKVLHTFYKSAIGFIESIVWSWIFVKSVPADYCQSAKHDLDESPSPAVFSSAPHSYRSSLCRSGWTCLNRTQRSRILSDPPCSPGAYGLVIVLSSANGGLLKCGILFVDPRCAASKVFPYGSLTVSIPRGKERDKPENKV